MERYGENSDLAEHENKCLRLIEKWFVRLHEFVL